MISDFDSARTIALTMFRRLYSPEASYTDVIEHALQSAQQLFPDIDMDALRKELESSVNIRIDISQRLVDDRDHVPWLRQRMTSIEWRFWSRYQDYLLHERRLPLQVVDRLDETSAELLELLEDPSVRDREFDRRGLVMGHVQSGKTTHYSALINKALDAGYKLVIVLAGTLNNLRSQTQLRLDEEVLGFDTAQSQLSAPDHGLFGVGLIPGTAFLSIGSLTSWEENGDFRTQKANSVAVQAGGNIPLILVVKKNATVLRNLGTYFADFSAFARKDPKTNLVRVHNVPLLVIDDEADLASVNTHEIPTDEDGNPIEDHMPSKINELIRSLLFAFTQSAYVGYTATPFANIFIHNEDRHSRYGEDLFPRSFIIALPAPGNYIGPSQLLGLEPGTEPMPVFRSAEDGASMIPPRHKKTFVPNALSPSLRDAIRAFVLSSAARLARGDPRPRHNSMLIHVTRFTMVQNALAELVQDELRILQRALRWTDGSEQGSIRSELRKQWLKDFVPTSTAMGQSAPEWSRVEEYLDAAAALTKVRIINGTSADILDYRQNAVSGINVIAVGGDKLSRGLTLEGLTVSYFLRSSKMYDTLMQMGRWFGYRDGYQDLCRIYTTDELRDWFRHIAMASEELRREFDYMASVGGTPADFGLRVRSHPVLMVTSRVKMREGEELELTYQGDISETTVFHRDSATVEANLKAVNQFLERLGQPGNSRESSYQERLIWRDKPASLVLGLLRNFRTHEDAPRADAGLIARFIEEQNALLSPELTTWTVAVVSQVDRDGVEETDLGGRRIVCIQRKPRRDSESKFSIQRLLSPTDEGIDISASDRTLAYDDLKRSLAAEGRQSPDWELSKPPANWLRQIRPKERGLLLIYPLDRKYLQERFDVDKPELTTAPIGLGFSFPGSRSGVRVKYIVNRVWKEEEL